MSEINYEQFIKTMEQLKGENSEGKKIKGFAKRLTYTIIIITFLIGIVGSLDAIPFNMESFVSFLPMFAALFIPLIISIGYNSAVDRKGQREVEREEVRVRAAHPNGN